MLKLRVIDKSSQSSTSNSAIISVWNAKEEIQEYLKEKRSYGLYNIKADGLRAGDLQLTAIRNQTRWEEMENTSPFDAVSNVSIIKVFLFDICVCNIELFLRSLKEMLYPSKPQINQDSNHCTTSWMLLV